MSNEEAISTVITALSELGRIETVDAALLTLCVSLARALDDKPSASLFREYRGALADLRHVTSSQDEDTDLFDLMAQLSNNDEVEEDEPITWEEDE